MPFGYIPQNVKWKDLLFRLLGWPNTMRRLQAPVVMRMINSHKDDIILDAGCGGGNFTFEMAKHAKQCIGIDIRVSEKASSASRQCPPGSSKAR